MEDVRQTLIEKTLGGGQKKEGTISEVKQATEDMSAVDSAMDTARKLAGTDTLTAQLNEKDKALEKERGEKEAARKDAEASKLEVVESRLGAQIERLQETIAKGGSSQDIATEIGKIKQVATELGMGTSKVSELREMFSLFQAMAPQQKGLAEQVKEAKELLSEINPEKKETGIAGVSDSVAIQLKKMDQDLQITLAKMADDRQARDQEFTLKVKKWDEEREMRAAEITGKIKVEQEKNAMFGNAFKTVGAAIAGGAMERAGGTQAGGISQTGVDQRQPFHLEVEPNTGGEFDCPYCAQEKRQVPVAIGPTSQFAQCPSCNARFPIVRKAPQPAAQPGSVEPAEAITVEEEL